MLLFCAPDCPGLLYVTGGRTQVNVVVSAVEVRTQQLFDATTHRLLQCCVLLALLPS